MWILPKRDEDKVCWDSVGFSSIEVVGKWRKGSTNGNKTLPSLIATRNLEPGQKILCFGRISKWNAGVAQVLAEQGHREHVDHFRYIKDVSCRENMLIMDASPTIDPIVEKGQIVSGNGLFCWSNVQEPLVGYMPNVLFQKTSNWTKKPEFREIADWFRGEGNWAWFKMTESLATQLDRNVCVDEVELLYMTVIENIRVGEHLFASRGRVVFSSSSLSECVPRITTLEDQLNRSPLCFSQRFITVAENLMGATGFVGPLSARMVQLFTDVGKMCDVEAVRTTLCLWNPKSRDNRMGLETSDLLNSISSPDITSTTPPSLKKVVHLWKPKIVTDGEQEPKHTSDELLDFEDMFEVTKRKRSDWVDGEGLLDAYKKIISDT